jgi:GNAT superfamily N-acetyltransferase
MESNQVPRKIYTLAERPELRSQVSRIYQAVWPVFMNQDAVANRAWDFLFDAWAEYQLVLCDEEDIVLAAGNTVPLMWDSTIAGLPSGWDAAAEQAMQDYERGVAPTALSAYAIVVDPVRQGQGLSSVVLDAMAALARQRGLMGVIACVRPTQKALYPLTPFERYVQWKRENGLPFDPWIRVHWRAGARLERVSPDAMVIKGTVAEWEEWTGLRFPESGPYVVPGALQPVLIDVEKDLGVYLDPNVWMVHWTK